MWHDAQSMSNGTPNCNVTVWQFTNSQGDTDWLSPGWGGNLTSTVSDHDESISANHCT